MQNFESIVGVNFWTALFTLCNMLITFLILKKLLFKPVKKMIDDRQKEIADQYAEAERRRQEAEQAILVGVEAVKTLYDGGVRLFATGEMGIGNTTTSSAVAAVLLAQPVQTMTGRGASCPAAWAR